MTVEEKIMSILKKHNIKMSVAGCGCCGSPWVRFEYEGVSVCNETDHIKFDMFAIPDDREPSPLLTEPGPEVITNFIESLKEKS